MRGAGGPLLCIGDLLCDVGEPQHTADPSSSLPSSSSSPSHRLDFQPSRLTQLFQEDYDQLNKALAGTDHSWTSLTLKLCTTLDTAKKLIESANTNVTMLSEKVGELEKIVEKEASVISEVRSIHTSLSQKIAPSTEDEV